MAGEVGLGYARLRNVVFLVLADEALQISPLNYPIHGILGVPALRALGCVDLSAKGELTLDCGAKPPQSRPNFTASETAYWVIDAFAGGFRLDFRAMQFFTEVSPEAKLGGPWT